MGLRDSQNRKGGKLENFFMGLIVAAVFLGLMWTIWWYAGLPIVEFSVSQQKVVAVKNAEGKALPLSPLPEKYEKVYVE